MLARESAQTASGFPKGGYSEWKAGHSDRSRRSACCSRRRAKDHGDGVIVNGLESRVESKNRRQSGRAIGDDNASRLELGVSPAIALARPGPFRAFDSLVTVEVCSSVDRHSVFRKPPDQISAPIEVVVDWPRWHAFLEISRGLFGVDMLHSALESVRGNAVVPRRNSDDHRDHTAHRQDTPASVDKTLRIRTRSRGVACQHDQRGDNKHPAIADRVKRKIGRGAEEYQEVGWAGLLSAQLVGRRSEQADQAPVAQRAKVRCPVLLDVVVNIRMATVFQHRLVYPEAVRINGSGKRTGDQES